MNARAEESPALRCSRCGCGHFYLVDSRPSRAGVRRRRQCRHCGQCKTTMEALPTDDARGGLHVALIPTLARAARELLTPRPKDRTQP